ncbi:ABC transporter substrate-binding protein [Glaciimonas sp. CA11.2]|uniref:ABC transporter substrate-binding protein n=2 Tax=Glaciimonas sp. CA11.2 TaxID=3048601 RepID=UPI002AB4EE18|nr:ABC transporter substrate-binding protein [Glaciimonas sp. CA11.2]MDY7544728.1 ABC transporter substrate-binding protein [Glaciimonas sp. CA11.2]
MRISKRLGHLLLAPVCMLIVANAAGTASNPADLSKVVHVAFEAADDGFDMVRTNNSLYSTWVGEAIYESLLTYDYLARPAKLIPKTVEAMPEISKDGRTYVFHIKKGIFFTPDPAFNGARRELTAQDYAYSIKRVLDPKNRSPQASSFEGKIVGLDAIVEEAKKLGQFNYDAPVAGLETLDRYTLRIQLNALDQTFLYLLAHSTTGAVAREVIEKYGADSGRHPVGTGAYFLKEYVPRSKIVLEANPDYRGYIWNFKSSGDAWDKQVIKDMQGKHMPQVGRVEISIIEEEQPRWLAFDSGQLDIGELAGSSVEKALNKDVLKPQYTSQGVSLYRFVGAEITHTIFNFKDPIVGGYTKEKIALRRAIAMAYNLDDEIRLVRFGQATKAQSEVPPGVAGYDPKYRSSIAYDPNLANKLLDYFKYGKGSDGYRNMPDGKPFTIKIFSTASSADQARMEIWKRSLDEIGLRTDFPVSNFADNLKAASECKLMMWGLGGTASIPDGSDFLESFYGPNAGQGNLGCYASPAFDDAYRKARVLPDGPERQVFYNLMERQIEADTAQVLHLSRFRNWVIRPWVKGFKKHPILHADWEYLDIQKH